MAYWLKLQGSSQPKSARVPNYWRGDHTGHAGTIKFESGPAEGRCPIEVGDGVILAASGWSRIFAAVRIVDGPDRAREPRWGPRWPWVLYGEAVAWVERVEVGPKIVDAGLPRSYGASYQRISEEQYENARESLHRLDKFVSKFS
jgi:hypothetical protein